MKVVAKNSDIQKSILIPGSKSYANRALIRASVKEEPCLIKNVPRARDTRYLIQCLKDVGLDIREQGHKLEVTNSFPRCEKKSPAPIPLQTGDGGTTNRFLIPLLALGTNRYHLLPDGKIMQRPFDPLPVLEMGADHFKIQGPWPSDTVQVDCSRTTQMASALMLVGHDVQIANPEQIASLPYLEMTRNVMENFSREYTVGPDWSSAAFPSVFAAIAGSVCLENIKEPDPHQADSALLEVLQQVGARCSFSDRGLEISAQDKCPFHYDCKNSPDLFPALTFLASYLEGTSTLTGFDNIKLKESDRLSECLHLLDSFGVSYRLGGDELAIEGGKPIKQVKNITTAKDHRIVMVAYLFLRFNAGGTLLHPEEVAKSFPEFFAIME